MDYEMIIQEALANSASAKELGEKAVRAIVSYYIGDEKMKPVYDPSWFEGWNYCEGGLYEQCGIEYDDIRASVVEELIEMEELEEGVDLDDYEDEIFDRVNLAADELLHENYHVVELENLQLYKARD